MIKPEDHFAIILLLIFLFQRILRTLFYENGSHSSSSSHRVLPPIDCGGDEAEKNRHCGGEAIFRKPFTLTFDSPSVGDGLDLDMVQIHGAQARVFSHPQSQGSSLSLSDSISCV